MKRETEHVLRERAAKLAALTANPSFQELLAEFDRREARDIKAITADLIAGKAIEDAQREIDYARGFAEALQWVARVPQRAEDTLERMLTALREANQENEVSE